MNRSNECAWVSEVLPEFLAERVSADYDARVRAHLEECSDCRTRANAVSVLQQTPVPMPDPERWNQFVSGVVDAAEQERQKTLPRPLWAAVAALVLAGAGILTWAQFSGPDDSGVTSLEALASELAELPELEAAAWTVGMSSGPWLPAAFDLAELTEEELERLVREVEQT